MYMRRKITYTYSNEDFMEGLMTKDYENLVKDYGPERVKRETLVNSAGEIYHEISAFYEIRTSKE